MISKKYFNHAQSPLNSVSANLVDSDNDCADILRCFLGSWNPSLAAKATDGRCPCNAKFKLHAARFKMGLMVSLDGAGQATDLSGEHMSYYINSI